MGTLVICVVVISCSAGIIFSLWQILMALISSAKELIEKEK